MTQIEKWKYDYFKGKDEKYKNYVNRFIDYLKFIEKVDTPNKVTIDDVSNGVGHYVKIYSIISISSVELYLESLKDFYYYLSKTGKSKDIFYQVNYEKYKNDLVNSLKRKILFNRFVYFLENLI